MVGELIRASRLPSTACGSHGVRGEMMVAHPSVPVCYLSEGSKGSARALDDVITPPTSGPSYVA